MANLFNLFLAVLVMLLASCGGSGSTQTQLAKPEYYVSPSGSDTNPGTLAQPWKTLNYAVSKLKSGDTLYARGGIYAERVTVSKSGTASSPITITNYSGESPIIDGAGLSVGNWETLLALNGNYINTSGFEIRNINIDGYGGNSGSIVVLGGYGVSIQGNNDTISHLNVHNTWAQGIFASGDNSTIQDSTIYNVALSNCRLSGQPNCSGTTQGWPSCVSAASNYGSGNITHGAIIQRNIVHDCWGEGISTWLADGTIIQDNVTYDNWALNLYVNNSTNVLVQRNIIYNTPNNYVQKQSGFTLADEITSTTNNPLSSGNTVINNFVYNSPFCAFCWTQVPGSGLNNVLIANNTIVATFSTGGYTSSQSVTNTNSRIINNIVTGTVSVPSSAGLTFSNNLWASTPPVNASGSGDVIGDPLLFKTGSTGPGLLTSGYFNISATSPAIGKGTTLPQVITDFFGLPRKSIPTIGGAEK
jgi:hypothetical protein